MKLFSSKNTTNKGFLGEDLAEKYLIGKGYRIIERNFNNTKGKRVGEIDIVAEKNGVLVFIEVKTRYFYGAIPEENISRDKLKKLSKIINLYISQKKLWHKDYRLDAISIIIEKSSGKHKITHIENIFL